MTSFGEVLLFWAVASFEDVLLSWVVTSIGDVLLACVVTLFNVVGGNVVRLNTTDPLLSKDLVENLHATLNTH